MINVYVLNKMARADLLSTVFNVVVEVVEDRLVA